MSPEQPAGSRTLTRNGPLADCGHEVLIESARDGVQPGPRVAPRLRPRSVLARPILACRVSTSRPSGSLAGRGSPVRGYRAGFRHSPHEIDNDTRRVEASAHDPGVATVNGRQPRKMPAMHVSKYPCSFWSSRTRTKTTTANLLKGNAIVRGMLSARRRTVTLTRAAPPPRRRGLARLVIVRSPQACHGRCHLGPFPGTDPDAGRASADREPRIESGFTSDHAMMIDTVPKTVPTELPLASGWKWCCVRDLR